MTPPPLSARDYILAKAAEIGSVPSVRFSFVCPHCLGPIIDFPQCYGCSRLFGAAPNELGRSVVPMSVVVNPSPWYARLVNYKNGSEQDHTLVSALTSAYLAAHESRIEELLGGAISQVAVVPSTRGRKFDEYPLARVIKRSRRFSPLLTDAIAHVPGATIARQEYKPSLYIVDASAVQAGRFVLIEDLWVSGGRAVSAAGALLDAGADAVAIVPVAREIRPSTPFCPNEYVEQVHRPYDVEAWPR